MIIRLVCAGADDGSCLAVVSKGTRWQQQSYKVDDNFPYDWVKKKWGEKFAITSIATSMKNGEPVSTRACTPDVKIGPCYERVTCIKTGTAGKVTSAMHVAAEAGA